MSRVYFGNGCFWGRQYDYVNSGGALTLASSLVCLKTRQMATAVLDLNLQSTGLLTPSATLSCLSLILISLRYDSKVRPTHHGNTVSLSPFIVVSLLCHCAPSEKQLGRDTDKISAVVGYAGGQQTGPDGRVCYYVSDPRVRA